MMAAGSAAEPTGNRRWIRMEISVDFLDGRIVEYNTTSLVPSDPLKGSVSGDVTAKNYLTEYNLRLDLLETSGLRLDVYYNTISDVGQGDTIDLTPELGTKPDGSGWVVPAATRRIQGVIYLLSPEELEGASYILVRRCGEAIAVAWRQGSGNWLIDGMRFARMARQVYSDAQITSKNSQEAIMMNYLHNALPTLSEEEHASLTGYPLAAWEEIRDMESANAADAMSDEFDVPEGKPTIGDREQSVLSGEEDVDHPSADDGGPDSIIPEDQEFEEDDD